MASWCGWRGSNPRPTASEAVTLSTELQPQSGDCTAANSSSAQALTREAEYPLCRGELAPLCRIEQREKRVQCGLALDASQSVDVFCLESAKPENSLSPVYDCVVNKARCVNRV